MIISETQHRILTLHFDVKGPGDPNEVWIELRSVHLEADTSSAKLKIIRVRLDEAQFMANAILNYAEK